MAEPMQRGAFGGRGRGRGARDYRKPKDVKGTSLRLLGYVGKNGLRLAWVLVLMILATLSGVASSYLLKPLVDECILPNLGAARPDWTPLLRTLGLLGGIYLVSLLASYGQAVLMTSLSNRTINLIRRDLFEHLQEMPIAFFDRTENGEIMSRFTSDADTVQLAVEQTITSLLSSVLTFVSVVTIMLRLNAVLFAVTLVFIVLAVLITRKISAKSKTLFQQQQRMLGSVNAYLEEMVEGIKVVKAFTYEERAKAQFGKRNDAYRQAAMDANFVGMSVMPILGQLMGICYAVTTVAGAFFILSGARFGGAAFTVGSLGVFLTYTKQLRGPINQVSNQIVTLMSALAGAERIFSVMDEPVETDGGAVTLARRETPNGAAYCWQTPQGEVPLRGHIELRQVDFSYEAGKPVLHGVSLDARPGQRIALVGSTGAGKTTVTNLINRFYDVEQGCILYDGIDVRDIRKADLRRSMAVVLQDTHLFTGTVLDNIRYGDPEASDAACIEAARAANAEEFILALPQGFHTRITGDGGSLSQGQRQLLNIARAIVAGRPVLVLDEATSSIDTRTERMIESAMARLMQGRTVFLIAHRLSTVRSADKIAVIEGGRVIEFGSHEELLALRGKYYQLASGQAMLA